MGEAHRIVFGRIEKGYYSRWVLCQETIGDIAWGVQQEDWMSGRKVSRKKRSFRCEAKTYCAPTLGNLEEVFGDWNASSASISNVVC